MSDFSFPQQLGKYRLDAVLGQGAMGIVYKAFDTEIDRDVAIKVIHAHLLSDEGGADLAQRFKHEVKAAARCQHPNIVTVFDYGLHQGLPYMVMEYVNGLDLQIFLKIKHFLTADQAIALILKVLDALQAAHSMGIVHRDIKPANIMLLDNGQIKVTDFGVAHLDTSELTQMGDVIGTPCYMSPEARGGGYVSHLSDLYTTALVLLELLLKYRLKIEQINYPTLLLELQKQNLTPQLSSELAKVLDHALQREPQQRYPDALSFSKALSTCLDASSNYYQLADDLAATLFQVKTQLQTQANLPEKIAEPSLLTNDSALLRSQLSLIEKNLTHYLGPVAKMIVKKQASKTTNMAELLNVLIGYIPVEEEREKFIRSLDASAINKNTQISSIATTQQLDLPPEYVEKLTTELAYYLGPVAKHLMKSVLKKADSKEQLQALLAEKIPNAEERTTFLRKCLK